MSFNNNNNLLLASTATVAATTTDSSSSLTTMDSNARRRRRRRHHFVLPIFPLFVNHTTESNDLLLLANIPEHDLSREQYNIRRRHGYHERTSTKPNTDHQRRIAYLSRLWNINSTTLECNLTRLIQFTKLFGANRIHRFSTPVNQAYLHEDEYEIALEFFLQIDLNLFYMKTCSYRGALPVSNETSLLCMHEPQVRYGMTPCHRTSCCLCYPSYKLTYRLDKPIVEFGPNQQHQFINNYRSILNCPATCMTRNIIYVLTCPCHRVDYIGETSLSLPSRLYYHQKHGNRIIQEFLLGQKNMSRIKSTETKSNESLVKDNMALYQHSAHCPSAMQWFLDENPEYWPFIPIQNNLKLDTAAAAKETITATSLSSCTIDSDDMFTYAHHVPIPPVNYQFTHQQKIEIEQFFHEKKYLNSPNLHLDLYQATIVAILPDNASDALRRFIEALFITHTEAQLNTDGHLDQLILFPSSTTTAVTDININQNDSSSSEQQKQDNDHPWCKNLICRDHPMSPIPDKNTNNFV